MKNTHTIFALALSAAVSMPAAAGPNWDVIHKAEADKAAHKHERALVLPLDYGPRAITTPWLNRQHLSKLVAQSEAPRATTHAAAKTNAVVDTHAHAGLSTHS